MPTRTGGQVVVDALSSHGVSTAFGVPGESYLVVLDALHDTDIRYVTCRQESGAAYMAEAWGKLTGDVGVCMVTRGPGATNAAVGVHTASQDSTPMVLLVGQVGTDHLGREAFQEVDYSSLFGTIAKWVTQIGHVDDVAATMVQAFSIAASGRPGPVVVAMPEDVLRASTSRYDVSPRSVERVAPTASELEALVAHLADAERPVVIVGGGRWTHQARVDLAAFAEANQLPVVAAFRFHDLIDNSSPVYVGEAGVAMPSAVQSTIRDADVVLGLGIRFGEMTTGAWKLIDPAGPRQKILHIHPDPEQLGRIYDPTVGVVADPSRAIAALSDTVITGCERRTAWLKECRQGYLDSTTCPPQPGHLDMGEVMKWLQANLPDDVIVTNGAGNFTVWPNKFFSYGARARLLAPQNGTMGYGLPAAIAARAAAPERMVVCFAGDGDLQMTIQELATAQQAGLSPIVLVVDNAMFGSIRMHQERNYPKRVSGTDLVNPDFVAVARAYGFHAEQVSRTADFAAAFGRAAASATGALLHLPVDPSMLTPRESIAEARSRATLSPS